MDAYQNESGKKLRTPVGLGLREERNTKERTLDQQG
jgi:hypothetical protein